MEVPERKLPDGVVKRENHLYGIAGWLTQGDTRISGQGAYAFGGYFRHDLETGLVLDGQLVDSFGKSIIDRGKMDDETLTFEKRYEGRSEALSYEFKKDNGIWVGKWKSDTYFDAPEYNNAKVITTLIEDDAFGIACGDPRGDYERDPSELEKYT